MLPKVSSTTVSVLKCWSVSSITCWNIHWSVYIIYSTLTVVWRYSVINNSTVLLVRVMYSGQGLSRCDTCYSIMSSTLCHRLAGMSSLHLANIHWQMQCVRIHLRDVRIYVRNVWNDLRNVWIRLRKCANSFEKCANWIEKTCTKNVPGNMNNFPSRQVILNANGREQWFNTSYSRHRYQLLESIHTHHRNGVFVDSYSFCH